MNVTESLACPYCDATLNAGVISCRACGRDLAPVLPLLHRIYALETRLTAFEHGAKLGDGATRLALPPPAQAEDIADAAQMESEAGAPSEPVEPRRFSVLVVGFAALLAGYWTIALWLDLPLALLRLLSIVLPFAIGAAYFGARPRLSWFDAAVAVLFAIASVAAMNALLGWIDSIPIAPQGTAAWRETFFYALSIGASMFSGMLLRVVLKSLSSRGLTSLPHLRDGILAANGKVPMDALKAIELTILMVSATLSAVTGLLAGFLGVSR